MPAKMYIATETVLLDGEPDITRDRTIVSGDSDIYKRFTQYFREIEATHGVEQATAAPGELREVELPAAEPEEEPKKGSRK